MSIPSHIRNRPWIPLTLLLIILISCVIHMYRRRQAWCFSAPKVRHIDIPSANCTNNGLAVTVTFLGSRPFCMHLSSNDIVSNRILSDRFWEPQTTKFISLLLANSSKGPGVFLDIGANIGWFTVVMSVLGHKVIAIEPMYNNVKLMQASLQVSQASQNVIVYPHGLGVTPDKCIIISDDTNVGDGYTICGKDAVEGTKKFPGYSFKQVVRLIPLDVLVSEDIDVMKIDVEGFELFAVRSGIHLFDHYQVRHIITEFAPHMMREHNTDPYEYLQFFTARGYDIRVVNKNIGDLYENRKWQTLPIHKSEQDLQKLLSSGIIDLWLTKRS